MLSNEALMVAGFRFREKLEHHCWLESASGGFRSRLLPWLRLPLVNMVFSMSVSAPAIPDLH